MASLVCASISRGVTGVLRGQVRKDKSTKLLPREIMARKWPEQPRGVAELHPEMAV
jgi:hypothetical protein